MVQIQRRLRNLRFIGMDEIRGWRRFLLVTGVFIVVLFATVHGPLAIFNGWNFDGPIGADAPEYISFGGGPAMVRGHFLTLVVSSSLAKLSPGYGGFFLSLFFSLFLFWCFYYFMELENCGWMVALLLPLSIVIAQGVFAAALYGQIFSFSIFLIALGLFFRGNKNWSTLFVFLSILSHVWTGAILFGILVIYILIYEKPMKNLSLFTPLVLLVPFLLFLLPSSFQQGITGGKDFLYIIDHISHTNLGLILLGAVGFYLSRDMDLENISGFLLVYFISVFSLMIILPHRAWRFWLFVPFLFLAFLGANRIFRMNKYTFLLIYGAALFLRYLDVAVAWFP